MNLPAHVDEAKLAARLDRFHIETPSWGYADTGTRFGKFLQDAAATTWQEKLADAAQVHKFTGCCPSVAVHVLWDFPEGVDPGAVAAEAARLGLRIGSINPNLFQDQCYKFGSLASRDEAIRRRALAHVRDCIKIGAVVNSHLLSLWLADGTNYPGQDSIRRRKRELSAALREIHAEMPPEMTLLVEYKPFEPAFYHTDIADWGMAHALAKQAGPRAKVLVDTGHHLPGCNIEQIVAFMIDEEMLGGFHFNDRKYADDDLTLGSIDPYQLFRIFAEIAAAEFERGKDLEIAYMIDQSHNEKPKIEAMIQSVTTAQSLFTRAKLIDFAALERARAANEIIDAEQILKRAFEFDLCGWLAEYRSNRALPPDPLATFRGSGYSTRVAAERGPRKSANVSAYA